MYERDFVQAMERPEKGPLAAQNVGLDVDEKSNDGASSDEGSSSMTELPPYGSEIKIDSEESCPVCGDKVSGYHYGLQTCESCKGFFKRTVQNKKVYSCVDNRNCQIDKTQRKRCPYCRFQKCLSVGMKLEAVRADRMRGGRNKFGPMYKRDRALRQQAMRQRQQMYQQCGLPMGMDASMFPPGLNMDMDIKPDISSLVSQTFDSHPPMGPQMSLPNMPMHHPPGLGGMPPHSALPSPGSGHMTPPPPVSGGLNDGPMYQTIGSRPSYPSPLSNNHYNPDDMHPQQQPPQQQPPPPQQQQQQQQAPPPGQQQQQQAPPPGHPPPHMYPQQHHSPYMQNGLPLVIEELRDTEAKHKVTETRLVEIIQAEMPFLSEHGFLEENATTNHAALVISNPAVGKQMMRAFCKLCDQNLFLLVEWARNASFFKQLKVEDQMKLLQNSWCELLILDFVYKQTQHNKVSQLLLVNNNYVNFGVLDYLGLGECKDRLVELLRKFRDLKIDQNEYICLKFLILLNPDIPGLTDRGHVEQSQERVNSALLEYCNMYYPHVMDKFGQLLVRLPEMRLIAMRGEDYLYQRHIYKDIPENTLLNEMLHSRRVR